MDVSFLPMSEILWKYHLYHLYAVEHGCISALPTGDLSDISLQGQLSLVCIVSCRHVSCLHRSAIVWKYEVCHLSAV